MRLARSFSFSWRARSVCPAFVSDTAIWLVPALTFLFVFVSRPLPLILTVPFTVVVTVTSRLPALAFVFVTVIADFGSGQPVTAILVLCLTTTPFWPVIVVGINSFEVHR